MRILVRTLLLALATLAPASSRATITVDAALGQPAATIYSPLSNYNVSTNLPAVGDVDGDGVGDLVLTVHAGPKPDGSPTGAAYLFFGRPGGEWPRSTDLLTQGADAAIFLRAALSSVSVADVTGDGTADLVFGAQLGEAPGRRSPGPGHAYVIFGRPRAAWPPVLDLTLSGADVTILGVESGDGLGSRVLAADVSGDGLADVIATARNAGGIGNARPFSGEVHVFFGRPAGAWPATIDLATTASDAAVMGARRSDLLGQAMAVGDLSGDGVPDLALAGDTTADPFLRQGEIHVIFGPLAAGDVKDLSATPANASVKGRNVANEMGEELAIGDLSGDGRPDLFVTSPRAGIVEAGRNDAGAAYAIFGPLAPGRRDLATAPADVTIVGTDEGDELGYAAAAGDFDGDGALDIAITQRLGDGPDELRQNAGETLLFRGPLAPGMLDTRVVPPDLVLHGAEALDFIGDRPGTVALGDVTGDGFADLITAADYTNGPANDRILSGEWLLVLGCGQLRDLDRNGELDCCETLPNQGAFVSSVAHSCHDLGPLPGYENCGQMVSESAHDPCGDGS